MVFLDQLGLNSRSCIRVAGMAWARERPRFQRQPVIGIAFGLFLSWNFVCLAGRRGRSRLRDPYSQWRVYGPGLGNSTGLGRRPLLGHADHHRRSGS